MGTSGEHPPDQVRDPARAGNDRLGNRDQTLSEGDQTFSDRDQTLNDSDQTLSDRDQHASDEDQAASDEDREHGVDPASHARTTAIRAETTRERDQVGHVRDDTASQRDQAATDRDEVADQRDRTADVADEIALESDGSDGHTPRLQDLLVREDEIRESAALVRQRAARDRRQAAGDRDLAARDREQAAQDRKHAGTDELTGARRRGVGLEELQREIDRARRTGQDLVVAYVDVDGLKHVNDTYGHGVGDDLLRDVVKDLRQLMRSYDVLVRLGGDEFLWVLPGVDVDQAQQRFDALSSQPLGGQPARSVSIGLAGLRDGDGAAELIERADHALLAARAQ